MRNLTEPIETNRCKSCKAFGSFCTTPSGGDHITCPSCCRYDYVNSYRENYHGEKDIRKKIWDADVEDEGEDLVDVGNFGIPFCNSCGIVYDIGCMHSNREGTDSVFNAHVIAKWKNLGTDEIHDGMPFFESELDWVNNINKVQILKWTCLNDGLHCSKSFCPVDRFCHVK